MLEQKELEVLAEDIGKQLTISMEEADLSEEEFITLIRSKIEIFGRKNPLNLAERKQLEKRIVAKFRGFDLLQDLLEDEEITEIMVNGKSKIFVEKNGKILQTKMAFGNDEKLLDVIQRIVSWNNQMVNEASPIVDTRLPDGSRVNIVLPPVAVDGATISIRRFPKESFTIEKLIEKNALSQELAHWFQVIVECGYNILVSGGTGSGKTTFLNVLANFIPEGERIVTIEDAAELQLQGVQNLVRLEARGPNLEGKLEVSIRDLVRASLRMRPDRIIVGECRGGEALEMLQAFDTGHDGSMSTGHSNSPKDMLLRLETMVLMGCDMPILAIRQQIASAVDIIVQLGRMSDGSRKVLEVWEVLGLKDLTIEMQPLFQLEEKEEKGELVVQWKKRNSLCHTKKLVTNKKEEYCL